MDAQTQSNIPSAKRSTQEEQGLDLKAAYTVLLRAYLRNHPNALAQIERAKETDHE
jgi:hypothetical protein